MKKILLLACLILLVNLLFIHDEQAFGKVYSLELYCIDDEETCQYIEFPHEPPYSMSFNVNFLCDTLLFCSWGICDIEDSFGGGSFRRFGFLFSADWNGKIDAYDFTGIWIDGIMFGYGKASLYASDIAFNFFFLGIATSADWF